MKKEEKNKDDDIWRGNSDLNLGQALNVAELNAFIL
jgi:hypothetical protein